MADFTYTAPARDWLPAGRPITYTFTHVSPSYTGVAAFRVEVSANGSDFTGAKVAGVVYLPRESTGSYSLNVAPYLEALFSISPPFIGTDSSLFLKYRVLAWELADYDDGPDPLITTAAHALNAVVEVPIVSGLITLSNPLPVPFAGFSEIRTTVNTTTNAVTNAVVAGEGMERCTLYPMQFYWLNRAGGWQTWVFNGKHEYAQDISEPSTWTDENYQVHRAMFPPISQTVRVFSGVIPLASFDTVYSILSSIRVFHLDGSIYREVNIDSGEYLRHKEGQRRKQLDFGFTYAETLTVQNA